MTGLDLGAVHPAVSVALRAAGWTADYRYDITGWVDELRREGFSAVRPAFAILQAVGGLTITPTVGKPAVFGTGPMVFEPVWAATGEAERIKAREQRLGLALCPIGEWLGQYILLGAEDGSVLAETTFHVLRVGQNLCDALRRMVVADIAPELLD